MNSPVPQDKSELIASARHGSVESLGYLLESYRNYLYLVARTQIDLHLSIRASPSDLVQDTFLQASQKFGTFRGDSERHLIGWLRRILVNNIVAAYDRHVKAEKRDLRRDRPLHVIAKSIENSSMCVERALD